MNGQERWMLKRYAKPGDEGKDVDPPTTSPSFVKNCHADPIPRFFRRESVVRGQITRRRRRRIVEPALATLQGGMRRSCGPTPLLML